jgi:hypothetical protein
MQQSAWPCTPGGMRQRSAEQLTIKLNIWSSGRICMQPVAAHCYNLALPEPECRVRDGPGAGPLAAQTVPQLQAILLQPNMLLYACKCSA